MKSGDPIGKMAVPYRKKKIKFATWHIVKLRKKRARRENVTSGVELKAESRDNDDGFEKHLMQGNRDGENKKNDGKVWKAWQMFYSPLNANKLLSFEHQMFFYWVRFLCQWHAIQ